MSIFKKIAKYISYLIAGLLVLLALFIIVVNVAPNLIFGGISRSHIEANVPNESDFDTFLKRDLDAYFAQKLKANATVEYEFLRNGPTQIGIAYPKYYMWLSVRTSAVELQGAARISAMDKKTFLVTDFISIDDMKASPGILEQIFPVAVVDKIKQHVDQLGE